MGKYFVKRVLLLIPTILLVCVIVFVLMRMIPMDAVATPAAKAQRQRQLCGRRVCPAAAWTG